MSATRPATPTRTGLRALLGAQLGRQLGEARFAHLDAMRAGAVLLVVVMHAGWRRVPGDAGVTTFFVISGFIINFLVLREHERSGRFLIGAFYRRRAAKLLPPLAVLVLLPTLVYAARGGTVDAGHVLAQVFFAFNWVEVAVGETHVHVLPGSQVVWSLAVEEQFYIVFALLWLALSRRASPRRALGVVAAAVLVVSVVVRLRLALDGASMERVYRGTDVRMDAIALGVLCALYWEHPRVRALVHRPGILLACLLVVAVSFVPRDEVYQAAVRPLPVTAVAALLLLYGLHADGLRGVEARLWRAVVANRAVRTLGLASYSVYLAHDVVMQALSHLGPTTDRGLGSLTLATAGLVVGVVAYGVVELPVLALRRRRTTADVAPVEARPAGASR